MAEAFAPFIVKGTMCNLTFYVMEGRNFVRKKSSLTRRKVLYAPQFENTRYNAGLMGQASKIASSLYKALPVYWRQSWMYRSFTGEAFTLLKKGKKSPEIHEELWQRYIAIVAGKQQKATIDCSAQVEATINVYLPTPPKRTYRKQNSEYWQHKTARSKRRKARKRQVLYHAGLMGRASKIGSKLYAQVPRQYAGRSVYRYLTGLVLRLLKQDISEEDIMAELLPALPTDWPKETIVIGDRPATTKKAAIINHTHGQYCFMPAPYKRIKVEKQWTSSSLFAGWQVVKPLLRDSGSCV